MKILSIVGARPEFVQAAPVSRALRTAHREILVHTGQHYDYQMSQAFFDELGIPAPDYNLEVGSGAQGKQTGEIMARLEEVVLKELPDLVLLRGDTNSTLAGALIASKLHVPAAHIEAGERSFDRRMPEEVNRIVADALADLHFCVSEKGVRQLAVEGVTQTAHFVGDVMLDAMMQNRALAHRQAGDVLSRVNVTPHQYALVTVHRAANTDDPARLANIVAALNGAREPVVFPAHPRTRKALANIGATFGAHVRVCEPVSYFEMMVLEENARLIATDSGGVQREAYFFGVPCITLRDETEWTETVAAGWNHLVGVEPARVLDAWRNAQTPAEHPPLFGDGHAAQQILAVLARVDLRYGIGDGQRRVNSPILALLK
ncbi:MAG: UDP-N-acetylglucosamine 2-epimerase (non-hydrolyzing) [Chloroflexi bacterium]|nr:UDP-N-acetylglucosamine 2-epimerase (non-hydrolyzing) [Chloroflexota bacterium]